MPKTPERLLILGGTADAAALARAAAGRWGEDVQVITSLAGRLTPSQVVPGHVRVGGFGGVGPLADYLTDEGVDRVVDATHPFADRISETAAVACARAGVPRLVLRRPPWRPRPGDRWEEVESLPAAAAALPRASRRVFLTTGPGGLDAFADLPDLWFLVRAFEAPSAPLALAAHQLVVARPPFSEAGERALMQSHRIDTLVTKQSGGPTDGKLAAARALGLRVVMVRRPPPPPGEVVETVDAAMAWIAAGLSAGR